MGWRGGFTPGRAYESPVKRIVLDTKSDLAVLKDRGLGNIDSILIPWGGGMHAHLGLEIAVRIARATGAAIHLLRVARPGVDASHERTSLVKAVGYLIQDYNPVLYHVQHADSVEQGIQAQLDAASYDLVIIGASHEWAIRRVIFGSIPDIVADRAYCSVLMVRRFMGDHWSVKVGQRMKRLKEAAGLTTSPEESRTERSD